MLLAVLGHSANKTVQDPRDRANVSVDFGAKTTFCADFFASIRGFYDIFIDG